MFLITIVAGSALEISQSNFNGYEIISSTGNESIMYNVVFSKYSNITTNEIYDDLEKKSYYYNTTKFYERICLENKLPKDGMVDTKICLDKDCKNLTTEKITYILPETIKLRKGSELSFYDYLAKTAQKNYCIDISNPLEMLYLKFGENSIIIEGSTSYPSTDVNVTQETGYTHLNLSSKDITFYMPFSKNESTIRDYSNFNRDGTRDIIIYEPNCIIGSCYEFNGTQNSKIQVEDLDEWKGSTGLTINYWIKRRSQGALHTAIGANDIKDGIDIRHNNDELIFIIGNNTDEVTCPTTNANLQLNVWHMITAVYNGTHAYTYVNASRTDCTPAPITGVIATTLSPFTIGSENNVLVNYQIDGWMDEVLVINKSLSDSEITNLHNNQYRIFNDTYYDKRSKPMSWDTYKRYRHLAEKDFEKQNVVV